MKVFRHILFILNIIAALALILTTLAGTVAPSRGLILSLMAFGYLPMLLLNVAIALLWMLFGRWECLLSMAAIASRYMFIPLFIQFGGCPKVPDAEAHPLMVTVLTYNVHQFQGVDDRPELSDSNAALFLALVREENPDVLCLQEYAAPKRLRVTDSLELLGYNHYYGAHTTSTGIPYGSVIFSRLPITFVKRIDSEKLMADVLKEDKHLRVCCLHMDSYRFDDNDREEIARIRHGEVDSSSRRTLHKVKETILSHEEEWLQQLRPIVSECSVPLVVAGDLNDISSSWLYYQMTKYLKDCFVEQGRGVSSTYNGGFPKVRIDMVLHSEGLKALSYKRIKSPMSDHYPVLTALEIEN